MRTASASSFAFMVSTMLAPRAGERGEVTESHLAWKFDTGLDVPSPVTDEKYSYAPNDRGTVWLLDAKKGKEKKEIITNRAADWPMK